MHTTSFPGPFPKSGKGPGDEIDVTDVHKRLSNKHANERDKHVKK